MMKDKMYFPSFGRTLKAAFWLLTVCIITGIIFSFYDVLCSSAAGLILKMFM